MNSLLIQNPRRVLLGLHRAVPGVCAGVTVLGGKEPSATVSSRALLPTRSGSEHGTLPSFASSGSATKMFSGNPLDVGP